MVIYILIVTSVFLLTIPENISNHIRATISSPLAPVQKVITQTSFYIKKGFEKIVLIIESADEKEKLKEEIFLLQNKIIKQQNVINVLNRKLGTVSELRDTINNNEKLLIANIIGYDASNFRRSILIDAGRKQGVSVNDAVVYGNALVGRISTIRSSSSRVMLITDPASNFPSRFLKSRVQGMVQGTAGNTCKIKYVPRHAKVKEGDKVVLSGIEGIFPQSIYIGDVVVVRERGANLFKDIKLKPRIDFSRIEHVLVIKKKK
ncbi:MAG: rod shape-determining protein MreC [Candidatus Scalinduaceae bacterium]